MANVRSFSSSFLLCLFSSPGDQYDILMVDGGSFVYVILYASFRAEEREGKKERSGEDGRRRKKERRLNKKGRGRLKDPLSSFPQTFNFQYTRFSDFPQNILNKNTLRNKYISDGFRDLHQKIFLKYIFEL